MIARRRMVFVAVAAAIVAGRSPAEARRITHDLVTPPETQPAAPAGPRWVDSLDAGYMRSQKTRQPILVFAGADWVAGSRQQWAVLQSPKVAEALDGWTLVHLDFDSSKAAARTLAIVAPPALRILDADGKPIASSDKPLNADGLSAWLANAKQKLSAPAAAISGQADALRHLGDADPAARESAIRQLRSDPAAAPAIVEALKDGALAERLSAVELLQAWKAPLASIDPWDPSTVTADRLAALRMWARTESTAAAPAPMNSATMREELDALVAAPTDAEARTVRERLIVGGDALLPLVARRLADHPSAAARQRLLALRYRLAATDRLAAAWPGGFDRLASADSGVRRSAMAELATVVDANDHRLLRELFADDDPFIRGQSLKLLRQVGGAQTGHDLIGLLSDPDKNVRAAVLSTLADSPDPSLSGDLLHYAAGETDEDLLVHVVHVLQVTPGAPAFDGLVGMLGNRYWRVRGEAAESMLGKLSNSTNEDPAMTEDRQAAGIAALAKTLDDPDGYVESRAANTLIRHNFDGAVQPLMAAAVRHPAVARDVLRALAGEESNAANYLPQVQQLARSDRADVRSAAVMAIAKIAPKDCGAEIAAALRDRDESVRCAGANAVDAAMVELFDAQKPANWATIGNWVADFRKGKYFRRPDWMTGVEPDLRKALADPQERTDAAVALAGMGQDDAAMPVLLESARLPAFQEDASGAMRWLPSDHRLELFDALMKAAPFRAGDFIRQLSALADPAAAERVWKLLGSDSGESVMAPAFNGFAGLYLGMDEYYEIRNAPDDRKAALAEIMRKKAAAGTDVQRTVALAMLQTVAPDQAIAAGQSIYQDAHLSESLRDDALRVVLVTQDSATSLNTAVSAMNDAVLRVVAMQYLAAGSNAIQALRGRLYVQSSRNDEDYQHDQTPVTVAPPPGLTARQVRAALEDATAVGNVDRQAYARYLLVLLGDNAQLAPLIQIARGHHFDYPWDRLVFRAISKSNDPSQIPVLQELYLKYKQEQPYQLPEFYWTVRSMTGPEILRFRKMVRDQVGMDNLR